MPAKKRPASKKSSTRTTARRPTRAAAAKLPIAAASTAGVSATPTIIYVHGIGNKPIASVLKCQWDTALFGVRMGERTRMAYWVNRERYPVPIEADCSTKDAIPVAEEGLSSITPSVGVKSVTGDASMAKEVTDVADTPDQARILASIAAKMEGRAATRIGVAALSVEAKVLPLPEPLRRFFARQVTRVFLRDVHDFLFDKAARTRMRDSVLERIKVGGGPFIVIAHSQGTMIAYDVLRTLTQAQADVRLFVTIGSPLGMQEVQDFFRRESGVKKGPLPFPPCVKKWLNVADNLDVVAIDPDLSNEFAGPITNHDAFFLNPDSPKHAHSATGYLSTKFVKDAVREIVGNGFAQAVQKFVIARDLVNDIEDAGADERRDVLIQLADPVSGTPMRETATALKARLQSVVADQNDARIDVLNRFVSARLTRSETEQIGGEFQNLRISTIWKNAEKRALIYQSTNTIQCRPATVSYGADGRDIHWAILDTGIRASHPHFAKNKNVVAQWDCTNVGAVRKSGPDADGNGHGTHVAGIIAGKHTTTMRESDSEEIEFAGMAPVAKLHDYRVLDDEGFGQDSFIIKALDHISNLNEAAGELVIHGVNLSLGGNFDPSVFGCGHTPLCQEIRRLWRQGVVVVLAAGNEGYTVLTSEDGPIQANIDLSIGDPANLDEAIAVGSVHRTNPHTYGVSYFSSRGPTADGRRKPDVVAPGEKILSACHQYEEGSTRGEDLYVAMSGTSMAAPHVSGLIASFLSLRREFIGYPDRVKEILTSNCVDLRRDPYTQGYGMPNLVMMLARN
jgi:subtilisin family serine protease